MCCPGILCTGDNRVNKFLWNRMNIMCGFLIGTDVYLTYLFLPHYVVRSDQGGSRNLFAEINN